METLLLLFLILIFFVLVQVFGTHDLNEDNENNISNSNNVFPVVLNILNEMKDTSVNSSTTGNQLATILYEASQYLQNSTNGQTPDGVKNLLGSLLNFPVKFTHNEKLMIVNTPPRTALELSLIVHNYDERMTEEQVEELIEIINNTCP